MVGLAPKAEALMARGGSDASTTRCPRGRSRSGVRVRVRAIVSRTFFLALVMLAVLPGQAFAAFPGRDGVIGSEFRGAPGDAADGIVLLSPSSDWRNPIYASAGLCVAPNPFSPPTGCDVTSAFGHPRFSPNGRELAFTAQRFACSSRGTADHPCTPTGPTGLGISTIGGGIRLVPVPVGGSDPAWSPDGKQLVFSGGDGRLYVVHTDGTGLRQLTGAGHPAIDPVWSATNKIAYVTLGGTPIASNVMTFDLRTNRSRQLTFHGGEFPDWSPHGSRILFTRTTRGIPNIWEIDPNGHHLTRLTAYGADQAAFAPDGHSFVFSRLEAVPGSNPTVVDGETVIARLGSRSARIVSNQSATPPTWQPCGPGRAPCPPRSWSRAGSLPTDA